MNNITNTLKWVVTPIFILVTSSSGAAGAELSLADKAALALAKQEQVQQSPEPTSKTTRTKAPATDAYPWDKVLSKEAPPISEPTIVDHPITPLPEPEPIVETAAERYYRASETARMVYQPKDHLGVMMQRLEQLQLKHDTDS